MPSKRRPPKKPRAERVAAAVAPAPAAAAPARPAPVPGLPLFYQRPRVLHPAAHGGLTLATDGDFGFAAGAHAVPLLAAEVVAASRHAPVVFSRGPDAMPLMVLGLQAGQGNLFVDAQGRWAPGVYIPAYVRRYPFLFLEDTAAAAFTLCIDEAAPALQPGDAQPLFDPQGLPTALTRSALDLCRDYQAQQAGTRAWVQALQQAGLLRPQRADLTLPDGRTLAVDGFQVIDEDGLARLPAATLLEWRDAGWLPAVYAQQASAGLWGALADRAAAG